MRRILQLSVLCAVAGLTMGARGCDDDLPVGMTGADAGSDDPSDAGVTAADAGRAPADGGMAPEDAGTATTVTRVTIIVSGAGASTAGVSVAAYDAPPRDSGGPRVVTETFGPCEAARNIPGPGTSDIPAPVHLGVGAVEVHVPGRPLERAAVNDRGFYSAELDPPPPPGTEIEVVVNIPGGPTIRSTAPVAAIELVEPAYEPYEELGFPTGDFVAEYEVGSDFDVAWADLSGAAGPVSVVLYGSDEVHPEASEIHDVLCQLDYDDGAVRIPWRIFYNHVLGGGADRWGAGLILYHEPLRATETVAGIEVNTGSSSGFQIRKLRARSSATP